jgi:hypothetical protein
MDARPACLRDYLVKGGVKAGQCAGVKVGHFYMGRFLEVAGSVASEA